MTVTKQNRLHTLLWITIILLTAGCAADRYAGNTVVLPEGIVDGPYVAQTAEDGLVAQWVRQDAEGELQAVTESVTAGGRVPVAPVGSVPGFEVTLRPIERVAGYEYQTAPDVPLFFVADTHGEYEILAELLRQHEIVDAQMNWSFGNGRLVILGDVLDRGAHQTEILWLFYKLEAEAARAGGRLHFVIGNHESMVLLGDLRYLHPKYPQAAEVLGAESYQALLGPGTVLGDWLRSKPTVIKLNELLLVHGGISPAIVAADLSLTDINQTAAAVLNGDPVTDEETAALVMRGEGPHWYRGYFARDPEQQATAAKQVDDVRRHFGIDSVLVGHTPVPTVTPLLDGRVLAVQVYPHRDETTGAFVAEGVHYRNGQWYRATIDGRLEPISLTPPELATPTSRVSRMALTPPPGVSGQGVPHLLHPIRHHIPLQPLPAMREPGGQVLLDHPPRQVHPLGNLGNLQAFAPAQP